MEFKIWKFQNLLSQTIGSLCSITLILAFFENKFLIKSWISIPEEDWNSKNIKNIQKNCEKCSEKHIKHYEKIEQYLMTQSI